MTHTQGDWYATRDPNIIGIWHIATEMQHIAVLGEAIIGDAEGEANAHLVSAAPRLLAACEALVKQMRAATSFLSTHLLDRQADYDAIDDGETAIAIALAKRG